MPGDSGEYRSWLKVVALSLLIVALVGLSAYLSDDSRATPIPSDPADQDAATSSEIDGTPPPTTTSPTTTLDDPTPEEAEVDVEEVEAINEQVGESSTEDVVDTSSDNPLVESSGEQVAPEQVPELPASDILVESSRQTEEWLVGYGYMYDRGDRWGYAGFPPWLLPWGEGFLQVGYLNTGEEMLTRSRLMARTSDDGLNWSDPIELDVSRDHFFTIEETEYQPAHDAVPMIRSDGQRLVILTQSPGPQVAHDGAYAVLGRRSVPAIAHSEQRVFMSVTSDLLAWDNFEYPLLPPEGLHESLNTAIAVEDVIFSDEGWMIQISTLTYMDVESLLPANIRETAVDISWMSSRQGIVAKWAIEDGQSDSLNERAFSWDELETTYDLFFDYGFRYNKPFHPNHRRSGSALIARWSEEPMLADLLTGGSSSFSIVVTDTGYVGLSDPSQPGYRSGWFGHGTSWFSSDGVIWHATESLPVAQIPPRNINDTETNVWTHTIRALESDVIIAGTELYPFARFEREFLWIGDAKGTNWREVTISDNPLHESYRVLSSAGKGIMVINFVPLDLAENPDNWANPYHSTIVSTDGMNWYTVYEDTVLIDSRVAFNGNVAVRVDNAGNSFRYELP